MKNLLAICGSPREKGNSETALRLVIKNCEKDFKIETIYLSRSNLEYCNGCLICEDSCNCPISDDMNTFMDKLLNADIILISTPTYFDNIPAILKNFFDRTNPISGKLSDKYAYIMTFGQADATSWKRIVKSISDFLEIHEINIIGADSFFARNKDDVKNDKNIINNLIRISNTIKRYE